MHTLRASLVVIGDEILDGYVRDTNSGWLAGRLRALGIPLDRVSVVPDTIDAIVEALTAELARDRPRVVFTSGGIGTTPDDRTMHAVATFLGVDLVTDPDIDEMVAGIVERLRAREQELDAGQRAALAKLARVPQGATALTGPDGGAPSARIDLDGGPLVDGGLAIIVLPGVPSQFRELVSGLEPTLLAGRGRVAHVEELHHPFPESLLTPLLEDLERRVPDVKIGSYPGPQNTLRVQGEATAVGPVVEELREEIDRLAGDPHMQHLAERWRRGWTTAADRWPDAAGAAPSDAGATTDDGDAAPAHSD
jgi:nicotinamide-nucleotide amidase